MSALTRDPVVTAALESIFADTAREIEARGPACWASGRCCNFEKTGHRLYVTALEAAYTLSRLPPDRVPALEQIDQARAQGGCPFQQGNLCSVHEIKPLGCRVYFCDRSAQHWQQDLSERMLARIRAIHDRFAIPYRYAEWRAQLEELIRAGLAPPDQAAQLAAERDDGARRDSWSRTSDAQARPVGLTVKGSDGARPTSPDTPPASAAN